MSHTKKGAPCFVLVRRKKRSTDRCGFVLVDGKNVLPWVRVRSSFATDPTAQMVPLFYFEGRYDGMGAGEVTGWDLAYLKLCLKVQKVDPELWKRHQTGCRVIPLEVVKRHFNVGTIFEEYWPDDDDNDVKG